MSTRTQEREDLEEQQPESQTHVRIECQHCAHRWNYTGNRQTTNCPSCGYKVNVAAGRKRARS